MVARTFILFSITAIILAGFVWLAPLNMVLKARGYSPEQITAMKTAVEPQPGPATTPAPAEQTEARTDAPADSSSDAQKTTASAATDATTQQQPQKAEQTTVPTPPPRQFVSTSTVNVRAGQGTDNATVGQLKPRTVVTVVAEPSGDWMKVKAGEVTGWVYRPLFERRAK